MLCCGPANICRCSPVTNVTLILHDFHLRQRIMLIMNRICLRYDDICKEKLLLCILNIEGSDIIEKQKVHLLY